MEMRVKRVEGLGRPQAVRLRSLAGRLVLPAILLVAFALRVYRLGDKNIWWDEGLAIWAVRKSLSGTTLWTAGDVHPPLYFWTLWGWIRLAGETEFAARFISAIWGLLTVAVAYALGVRIGGRRVGLLGATLLAVSRFHVWWSQEMRMYILATLAATATLYTAVRWLEEESARQERWPDRWLMGYILAATASLYTIYVAALAPLVANGYAAVALARLPKERRGRVALRWLTAQAVAVLLFIPWLLLALPRMQTWSVAEPFSFRLFLKLYAVLLSLGLSTDIERYTALVLPFAAVLLAGLATLAWRRRDPGLAGGRAIWLFLLALGLLPLTIFVLTRTPHLFYTPRVEARYLLLFAPLFYLFLAWSVARLAARWRPLALVAVAVTLAPMLAFLPGYYTDRYLKDDAQTMAYILGACARPEDAILLISGDRYPIFGYYYERLVPPGRQLPVIRLPRTSRFTEENVASQLEEAIGGRRRFWVVAYEVGIQDPSFLSLAWLDAHYPRAFTQQMGHNALILYGDAPEPLLAERAGLRPQHPLAVQAGGLELLGYDLPVLECQAGDTVDLGLYHAGRTPTAVRIDWMRASGELLDTVTMEWPATGSAGRRATARFDVWPWYPAGGTCFALRWSDGDGEEHSLRLGGPRIVEVPGPPQAGRITQPLEATLAGGIHLRGYDLHRPVRDGIVEARPGEELVLDLFWDATEAVGRDYTVFTQLVGSAHNPDTGGPVWGQHDGEPVGGSYPTGRWKPGQTVVDRHVLKIDPDAPAGEYELHVGMYLLATLERLPVQRAGDSAWHDHIVLTRVRVTGR